VSVILSINQNISLQELRCTICARRSDLSKVIQQNAATKIVAIIKKLPVFKISKFIAVYSAFNNEVNLQSLICNIWQEQKWCYLPLVEHDQMLFVQYEQGDKLIKNRFGILEPLFNVKKVIKPENLDLVIVPLVGFDENGNRLGTGGGYYDRTFAFKKQQCREVKGEGYSKPCLLGVAYETQKLASLTSKDWDVSMDMVITERQVYSTTPSHTKKILATVRNL
jgi:5-formyltetrahydrofolate cyclo-ligase